VPTQPLTICDVAVERRFTTPLPPAHGWLDLTVADASGAPAPARVGLYDATGRMPIPSAEAVEIKKFDDRTRTYLLRAQTVWPADNKYVFHVDGQYRATAAGRALPPGRVAWHRASVRRRGADHHRRRDAGEDGAARTLRRPAGGGLVLGKCPHSLRASRRRRRPRHADAGAGGGSPCRQPARDGERLDHPLPAAGVGARGRSPGRRCPRRGLGQEDPRTGHRGHTIHLDLTSPVRFPDEYLLYHKVFEAVAAQEVSPATPTSSETVWERSRDWRSRTYSTSSTSSRWRRAAASSRATGSTS